MPDFFLDTVVPSTGLTTILVEMRPALARECRFAWVP